MLAHVAVALEVRERKVTERECPSCGRVYEQVMGFVHEGDDAHAIFYAACHKHEGAREVWMDVALGEWDEAFVRPSDDGLSHLE